MPGTVLSMQNIYLVKKNYANPPEGDTKPPEDSASMKFVYHQLNGAFDVWFISFKKGGKIQTGLNCEVDSLSKACLWLAYSNYQKSF